MITRSRTVSASHSHVSPDSFALSSFAHLPLDLTFHSCNRQVCHGHLFCLGTHWTVFREHTICCSHVGRPGPLSSSTGSFLSKCMCDWKGIPNWTNGRISEEKVRTRPLTEDISYIIPLLFEPDLRFGKKTWYMVDARRSVLSIQRPESCLVIWLSGINSNISGINLARS